MGAKPDVRSVKPLAEKEKEKEPEPVLDPPGFYTVRKGDTLSKIAERFNQIVRDLSDWNNLQNPNDIKAGQQLRIAPPEGVQVASVPIDAGMEIRPLNSSPPASSDTLSGPRAPGVAKTAPMGNKVAYSDQAYADMQRAESGAVRTLERPRRPDPGALAQRFVWPAEGKVISPFDPARKGIDIAGQSGQPVLAAADGTVLYAKSMRGYGNLVIIDHGDGLVSAYAHNKTILVKEGQMVSRSQQIAEMGNSDADSVKLHFEIRQLGKPVDPVSMLPSR